MIHGFKAVSTPDARVLILGTLPGRKSLTANEYYANKQNAFWELMRHLVGVDPAQSYEQRVVALERMGVALWDVLESGERSGSGDRNIRMATAVPNDFTNFFAQHPSVELVCLNGKKAANLWDRLVDGSATIPQHVQVLQMPSTSSANTSATKEEKLMSWQVVAEVLR